MNKIQKFSRFFRILFQLFFTLLPISLIVFWGGVAYWHTKDFAGCFANYFTPVGIEILHPITANEAFYGFLASILPTIATMLILFFLIKLFRLYEKGEIFSQANVKNIRNIGIMMLVAQFIGFLHEGAMGFILTIHNPPGHRLATVTFGNYEFDYIIAALMIILISWVMNEGAKLQEEQKYTV